MVGGPDVLSTQRTDGSTKPKDVVSCTHDCSACVYYSSHGDEGPRNSKMCSCQAEHRSFFAQPNQLSFVLPWWRRSGSHLLLTLQTHGFSLWWDDESSPSFLQSYFFSTASSASCVFLLSTSLPQQSPEVSMETRFSPAETERRWRDGIGGQIKKKPWREPGDVWTMCVTTSCTGGISCF